MIDKNRGVTRRMTGAGVAVFEYKDQPGEYFDSRGNLLDEEYAIAAGFNTKEGAREKRKRELMRKAEEEIDEKLAKMGADVEKQLDDEEKQTKKKSSETPDGEGPFESVDPSALFTLEKDESAKVGEQFFVLDPEGTKISEGMKKTDAESLVEDMNKTLLPAQGAA